jgi:hypothetical protein
MAASLRVFAMAVPSLEGRLAQLIVLVRGPTRSFDLDQTSVAKAVVLFNCPGVTNRPGKGHGL